MNLTVNMALSIPVIVRHGKLAASAAIDPASVKLVKVEPKQQKLAFTLSRSGTRSIYGDAAVYRGEEKIVETRGLAVYTPNKKRTIELHVPDQFQLKSGDTVRVVFNEKDATKPLAEATAVLP